VRELENLIRRLAALYSEDEITIETIELELTEVELPELAPDGSPQEPENLSATVERHLARYFAAHGDVLPPSGLYDRILREIERPLIGLSLMATRGNQIRAAQMLGLNRNTLRKKVKDLDIEVYRGKA
jgi:two-component system nitrogen regulation response regulator GlnG